jgi:hypothetical protein
MPREKREPALTFSGKKSDFGRVSVGDRSFEDFFITNSSGRRLAALSFAIVGPQGIQDNFGITFIDDSSRRSVLPDARCRIQVRFAPRSSGRKFKAMLTISSQFVNDQGVTVDVVDSITLVGRGIP